LGENTVENSKLGRLVAYGNGKFPTSNQGGGQGHAIASTPLACIPKALSHFPRTSVVLTDEYNTSQYCYSCTGKLEPSRPKKTWKHVKKKEALQILQLSESRKIILRQSGCLSWSKSQTKYSTYQNQKQTCLETKKKKVKMKMDEMVPRRFYKPTANASCNRILTCNQQQCLLPKEVKAGIMRDRVGCENIRTGCISRLLLLPLPSVFKRKKT
jgi:hypothetical protein